MLLLSIESNNYLDLRYFHKHDFVSKYIYLKLIALFDKGSSMRIKLIFFFWIEIITLLEITMLLVRKHNTSKLTLLKRYGGIVFKHMILLYS